MIQNFSWFNPYQETEIEFHKNETIDQETINFLREIYSENYLDIPFSPFKILAVDFIKQTNANGNSIMIVSGTCEVL